MGVFRHAIHTLKKRYIKQRLQQQPSQLNWAAEGNLRKWKCTRLRWTEEFQMTKRKQRKIHLIVKIKKYNPHRDESLSKCTSAIFTTEMIHVQIPMHCCCCHGYHMGRTCQGNKILASCQGMHTTHHPVKPCTSGLAGSGCNTYPKDTGDIFSICMDDIWGQDRTRWEFFIPYGDHKHNWKTVNEQNLYVWFLLFQ